jgi:hypothetical protein
MEITSPIALRIKMRLSTSTLDPIARDMALVRTIMAVFILDLELTNVGDRLDRDHAGLM